MKPLSVTCDKNADLRRLRQLQRIGLIELHTLAIEGFENTPKIKNKELQIAVIGSKFAKIGQSAIASNHTPYKVIQLLIGKENHGDCLFLERHISSGRDVFVTNDNDILSKRDQLNEHFGIAIRTVGELEADLDVSK